MEATGTARLALQAAMGHCEVAALPVPSWVAFEVRRLRTPSLLWDAGTLPDPLRFAWCMPLVGEADAFHEGAPRLAVAERYGGAGVGDNGGGARCGVMDGVQIKGIGKTPLVGAHAPHWHAYGGARLDECLYDVIWTRIVQGVLPYGAAACHAILGAGTSLTLPKATAGGRTTEQRALLLRTPKLRVAHFLPTGTFDWRQDTVTGPMQPEAERVKAAVAAMPWLLARALGGAGSEPRAAIDDFAANLSRMLDRLAHQLAVAMSRRVVHGGLSLSNLGLDGSWLDFGATSCVADYGPLITGGARVGAWPPNSMQASHLATAFGQLARAIAKYAPRRLAPGLPDLGALFSERFTLHEDDALLALTGLDDRLLGGCDEQAKADLVACMRPLMNSAPSEPTKLLCHCPQHRAATPQQLGPCRLNSAMAAAACATGEDSGLGAWRHWLPEGAQGEALFAALLNLRDSALRGFEGEARERAAAAITANALRVNSTTPWLHRENFRDSVSRAIDAGVGLAPFVDTVVADSVAALAPSSLAHQALDTCFGAGAFCSLEFGLVMGGVRQPCPSGIFAAALPWARPGSLPTQPQQPPPFYGDWRVDGRPPTQPTADERIGACMRLLGGSRRRADTPASYAERVLLPAIRNDRARFFHAEDGRLVGFVLWATLGAETEARVLARRQLQLHGTEWREGTRLWIVDLFCLPGRLPYVLAKLRDDVFAGEPRVRYLRQRGDRHIAKEVTRGTCSFFFGCVAPMLCRCARPLAECAMWLAPASLARDTEVQLR